MCSTLEHRNARGAKVLWEKFESGEEADTEIQQQRNHAVTIVQEQTKAPTKASLMFAGTQEKCIACNKTVYPIEKTSVEGLPYHKNCFKCIHGGCTISPSNYAALEGRLYCKHHYSQLFKETGNYSKFNNTPALKPTGSNASMDF